jgi:hypothetical protein
MSRPLLPQQQLDMLVARAIHAGPSKWPTDLVEYVRARCNRRNKDSVQIPNDEQLEWFLRDWISFDRMDTLLADLASCQTTHATRWRRAVEAFCTSRHDRKRLLRKVDAFSPVSELRGRKRKRLRVLYGPPAGLRSKSATFERNYRAGVYSTPVEQFLKRLRGQRA